VQGGGFCSRCGGTGSLPQDKNLEVKIPTGIYEGSTIRLKGQGGQGLGGGPPGDLYLKVTLLPHPYFKVKGQDLEAKIVLRPEQAVLGDKITVPTMEGSVNMTIPAGSHNGSDCVSKARACRLKKAGGPVCGN
jgi:curved DNA-binding protein